MSMAWLAARKLRKVVDNVRRILAVEYVCAARAIELRAPLAPGHATGAALGALRTVVPGVGPDRFLSPELAAADDLLRDDAPGAALAELGVELE